MSRKREDLKGKVFGRWTVVEFSKSNAKGSSVWKFLCKCGELREVVSSELKRGRSRSCGCLHNELFVTQRWGTKNGKHGKHGCPEYRIWIGMRNRCLRESDKKYPDYGGRGIRVCDRWKNSFENFFEDMGERPATRHSIDRVDNDGDYCPENCKWSTNKEQCRNKRTNRMLTYRGQTKCLAEWAEESCVSKATFRGRIIRGWTVEQALKTPLRK